MCSDLSVCLQSKSGTPAESHWSQIGSIYVYKILLIQNSFWLYGLQNMIAHQLKNPHIQISFH